MAEGPPPSADDQNCPGILVMTAHRERSRCPIAYGLDVLGDRWTLLILRDLAFKGRHYFGDFLEASEGISPKVLTERLAKLERTGLVVRLSDPEDGRRSRYFLTDDGLDLLPVLIEMALWGSRRHPDPNPAPKELEHVSADREGVTEEARKRLTALRERARAEANASLGHVG